MMTTRNRAAPLVAMIAILAATMLIVVTPVSAAATNQVKFQYEAPAAGTLNLLAPEVASPPVAWMNVTSANAAAAYNMAFTSASQNDFKMAVDANNFVLGAARAAPLAANMVSKFTGIVENARAPAINQAATEAYYSPASTLAATLTTAAANAKKNYVDTAGAANDLKMTSGLTENAMIDATKNSDVLARASS
jgi:hypothetical protein